MTEWEKLERASRRTDREFLAFICIVSATTVGFWLCMMACPSLLGF